MNHLNAILTLVSGHLLAPFRNHAAWGLVFWSLVTGIIMTLVFGKTSNQSALRRAADNIRAQLFAVKIFKEDLVVTFRCQLELLKSTGTRLLHSIPPMLVMIVPFVFILTQLAMRYEFRPLVPGERTVVAVRMKPDAWKAAQEIELESGDGFVVETEPLRDEKNATVFWRVRASSSQPKVLHWNIGDRSLGKILPMAPSPHTLQTANPKRAGQGVLDQILYPAEPSLDPDLPIESIEIQLSPRETRIFGWGIPWWATFFVTSMLVALISGKVIGVQY